MCLSLTVDSDDKKLMNYLDLSYCNKKNSRSQGVPTEVKTYTITGVFFASSDYTTIYCYYRYLLKSNH